MTPSRAPALALTALAGILLVSVGWWAAALWPLPQETPDWVVRARAACFGSTESGLPNAGGWILLIGTPITMVGALAIMLGDALREGLRRMSTVAGGRAALFGTALALASLLGLAIVRVSDAAGVRAEAVAPAGPAAKLERLGRAAPSFELLDQHGRRIGPAAFRGRPLLVTFAYGRCETVCPLVVQAALSARERVPDAGAAVMVITLDPWRDTPARLPHIAAGWKLAPGDVLLGGLVAEVEAVTDAWGFSRARDSNTGEIAHPALVYVLDAAGEIAYVVNGYPDLVAEALRRL